MKKILIIINNFSVGGAERLVIDDANELLKRGDIDFKIITLKKEGKSSLSGQLDKKVKWESVDFGGLSDLGSWFLLYKNIKNYDPDILFTHLWFSNTIGRIAGKLAGVPKIISFEHNVYDTVKNWKMFFTDQILQSFSCKIIAVSRAVKRSLMRHGIEENKIDVILNGIDISKYQNLDIKTLDGKEKKDFTFVFIGRLIHQKGIDILLRAFASVKAGNLLIVGSGKEGADLVKLTKELNIENRVGFLGIRKDIPEILSYSDCFVLPSRYEGLPMVLLEAFASRKIIIVSNFESAGDVIKNNFNGFIFNINDIRGLSLLMNEVQSTNTNSIKNNMLKDIKHYSINDHIQKLISYI